MHSTGDIGRQPASTMVHAAAAAVAAVGAAA